MPDGIDIDWGALTQGRPDLVGGAVNAFKVGQDLGKSSALINANAMYAQDPTAGIQAITAIDPAQGAQRQAEYNAQQDRTANMAAAGKLAGGDVNGAMQTPNLNLTDVATIQGLHQKATDAQLAGISKLHEIVGNASVGLMHLFPIPANATPEQTQQVMAQRQDAALHLAQTSGLPQQAIDSLQNQKWDDASLSIAAQSNFSAKEQADAALAQRTADRDDAKEKFEEGKPQYVETKNADGTTTQTRVSPTGTGGGAPGAPLPTPTGVDATQGIPKMIADAAAKYGVDPGLALSVAKQESNFNPAARSPKGAIGTMQLMPATAQGLGVDPTNTAQNIDGGVRYLKQLSDQFGGDPVKIAAAYNAGPQAVALHGGVPPYAETQNYVRNVVPGAYQVAANGTTPPSPAGAAPAAPAPAAGAAPRGGPPDVISGNGGAASSIVNDPNAPTGAAYLARLPPGDRSMVQAYIDGRMPVPTAAALRNPQMLRLMQEATQADPTFEAGSYPDRVALWKSVTSGPDSVKIQAINQALFHATNLASDITQRNNVTIGAPFIGGAVNAVKNAFQDPTTGNGKAFDTDATALATEASKAFQGGAPHEAEVAKWSQILGDKNASPVDQRTAVQHLVELLHGALQATQDKFQSGIGPMASKLQIIHPDAAAAFQRLRTLQSSFGARNPPPAPPPVAPDRHGNIVLGAE